MAKAYWFTDGSFVPFLVHTTYLQNFAYHNRFKFEKSISFSFTYILKCFLEYVKERCSGSVSVVSLIYYMPYQRDGGGLLF